MRAVGKSLACASLVLIGAQASAQPAGDASADNVRAHMAFLASDRLKGREAGSPEYDMAADYVAAQMKRLGLKPMGRGQRPYFQPVPLVSYAARDPGALTLRDSSGRAMPIVFGKDYVVSGNPLAASLDIDAPLVFVGFGMVAPGRDDYRGLDVKGKIVVALNGAPKYLQTLCFRRQREAAANLERLG